MMYIDKTLELHSRWLWGKETGGCADLSYADLRDAALNWVSCMREKLREA